jgi:N-methylhydantoinase B
MLAHRTSSSSKIRDLTSEEFIERYRCDRFTATVLANRFTYIVEHMCSKMLTSAFSPILRDYYDFAATLTGPPSMGYPTPAMSNSLVQFTGTMTDAVRNTMEEFGENRLEAGDVIIANDPYRGGTHVNDMLFARPIFFEGLIVGFVNIKAHQLDMGGTVAGGFSAAKANVFEDGLRLSPRPLYKGGEPVSENWSLIFDNARFADMLRPDMQTTCVNLELGERLLVETISRYGVEAVHGAMAYACDAGAERMERALEAIPDGCWVGEDVLDADGVDDSEEYRVRVRITKVGSCAEVDFSGSSRQARTCTNATILDAKSAVGVAFKFLLDPQGRFTSGTHRPIDLVLPEQTVASALPPDGGTFVSWEVSLVIFSAVHRALAQAVGAGALGGDSGSGDVHSASGVMPDGTPWISVAQCGGEVGPFGATRDADADSNQVSYQANAILPAIEAIEANAPVVVMRHEIVPDTAGAGRHRGGAAVIRETLWMQQARHYFMSFRYRRPPGFGVYGGRDGRRGGIWFLAAPDSGFEGLSSLEAHSYEDAIPVGGFLDPTTHLPSESGEYVYPFAKAYWDSEPMATLRVLTNGGGGWGQPLERDPEVIKRDVRDGYLTLGGAARQYGVVVSGDPDYDPEGLVVDHVATDALRSEMSRR